MKGCAFTTYDSEHSGHDKQENEAYSKVSEEFGEQFHKQLFPVANVKALGLDFACFASNQKASGVKNGGLGNGSSGNDDHATYRHSEQSFSINFISWV